jgi:hypothetical protein
VGETPTLGDRHRRKPSGGEKRNDGGRCTKASHVLSFLGDSSSGGDHRSDRFRHEPAKT